MVGWRRTLNAGTSTSTSEGGRLRRHPKGPKHNKRGRANGLLVCDAFHRGADRRKDRPAKQDRLGWFCREEAVTVQAGQTRQLLSYFFISFKCRASNQQSFLSEVHTQYLVLQDGAGK